MFGVRVARVSMGLYALLMIGSAVQAEDFFLTDGSELPGRVWRSLEGGPVTAIHARLGRPDPAYPNAIMKLQQVAINAENQIYFCSGLDGCVMHLLDGRHEIMVFEFPGQIRDIACTGERDTVYFSVVPTPQNGEPLADGVIYRRNLGEGRPTVVARIRQSDVGGDWWGTFTIHNGEVLIATLGSSSRIFKAAGDMVTPMFATSVVRLSGFAVGTDGAYYYVNEGNKVYRTTDFSAQGTVLSTPRRLTDVTVRPAAGSPRP